MWGQGGGRSLITGNSLGAWVLRILIFAFMTGGALAIVVLATRFIGAALAQPTETDSAARPGASPLPLFSGALIMKDTENLPHAFDAGWKGQKVCEVLQETDELRAARCTFAPGAGHEKHWHGPHFGYVVEGSKMRTTDASGTVERDLRPGASWRSDGNVHEALNIGDRTAVYVIVELKKKL